MKGRLDEMLNKNISGDKKLYKSKITGKELYLSKHELLSTRLMSNDEYMEHPPDRKRPRNDSEDE